MAKENKITYQEWELEEVIKPALEDDLELQDYVLNARMGYKRNKYCKYKLIKKLNKKVKRLEDYKPISCFKNYKKYAEQFNHKRGKHEEPAGQGKIF